MKRLRREGGCCAPSSASEMDGPCCVKDGWSSPRTSSATISSTSVTSPTTRCRAWQHAVSSSWPTTRVESANASRRWAAWRPVGDRRPPSGGRGLLGEGAARTSPRYASDSGLGRRPCCSLRALGGLGVMGSEERGVSGAAAALCPIPGGARRLGLICAWQAPAAGCTSRLYLTRKPFFLRGGSSK